MEHKHYCAVTGKLTFSTALHVGVGQGEVGTDAPLRRNEKGEVILPGTALAGALRTMATRLAAQINFAGQSRPICLALIGGRRGRETCDCPVCHLFGEIYPGEDETSGGRASRLWVFDAPMVEAPLSFIRDGVGIDRSTGAAARAARAKYDFEILPAGAEFTLRFELEDGSENDQILLAAVLAEWQAGRIWLGGGVSRGLGNASLSQVHYYKNDLQSGPSLLNYLKSPDPITSAYEEEDWLHRFSTEARSQARVGKPPFIEVTFSLEFDGLFLTQDTTASGMLGFDHVSLLDGAPGSTKPLRPVLTGAGLKGALRSHAERIARTLAAYQAFQQTDPLTAFLNTCPACNPLQDQPDLPLTKCSQVNDLRRYSEAQDQDLCLACQLFGSSQRGSRLRVMDAPLSGEPVWKAVDFLAIDRFTGGGVEGAKFDAAALWRPTFKVSLFLEHPQEWELGWLALVMRDIAEGNISFGFGAAKGFGRASAQDFLVHCGFIGEDEWESQAILHEIKDAPGFYRLAQFDAKDWGTTKPFVKDWVNSFLHKVKTFSRQANALRPLKKDTYFIREDQMIDQNLVKLYPLHLQEDYHG